MIFCRDWWPWTKPGYITMTRRQSNNQRSGGIAAHPAPPQKLIPSAKIRWESSRLPRLFVIKTASSSLIIFQMAKLSTRSVIRFCWCNWRTFWRKSANAAGRSPRGSCSCTTMPPAHRALEPRKNWPTRSSNILITHPVLQIWHRRTTTCFLAWKTIERSPVFFTRGGRCCRGDLVGRTNLWIFLSGLQKLEQRVKSVLSFVGCMLNKCRVWSL